MMKKTATCALKECNDRTTLELTCYIVNTKVAKGIRHGKLRVLCHNIAVLVCTLLNLCYGNRECTRRV